MKKLIALSLVLLMLISSVLFTSVATAEIVERPPTATPTPTAAPTPSPYRTWNVLSAEEQKQTKRIKYINNKLFYYEPQISACMVSFSFKDKDERYLAAPAIVTIRIENKKGQIIYEKTQEITIDDFDKYISDYRWDRGEYLLAEIPVFINAENIEDLKIFLYIALYDGYYMEEVELKNNYLKLSLPQSTHLATSTHSVSISNLAYRYTYDRDLFLYLTGSTNLSSQETLFPNYNLLDNEGYLIEVSNGYVIAPTGTKFKDARLNFFTIDPGTYSIE